MVAEPVPTGDETTFPRPFYASPWPPALRGSAQAFWNWHLVLQGEDLLSHWSADDVVRAANGESVGWLPSEVSDAAYGACRDLGISFERLADQIRVAPRFHGRVRFEDAAELDTLINAFSGSHALLLAGLADAAHSWQVEPVREFARGLFLTGRLIEMKRDVSRDRLFIPLSDLRHAGVSEDDLAAGEMTDARRRLMWKQLVRARDALAHGASLATDLPRRYARALKLWWMAGVEALNLIERRDYDVWTRPVVLSPLRRAQVHLQARFGRTTFRSR